MDPQFPQRCCVCGRTLPNKYAVAGVCEADGCGSAFCTLHWHTGNRRCPAHGWEGAAPSPKPSPTPAEEPPMAPVPPDPSQPAAAPVSVNLTIEQKRTAARAALDAIAKLGTGVAGLVKKLAGVQDPQEMIDSFTAALDANRARREPLRARYDTLYREIAAKKRDWQSAPPARKRILDLELRTLLSEYQGIERQLTAYFQNERTLVAVRTRVEEIVAIEMRKVSEKDIDRLTDKLDDAVADAEDVAGAVRDLEGAGKRREDAGGSLEDALAGFDTSGDLPEDGGRAESVGEIPHAEFSAETPRAESAATTPPSAIPDIADLLP